MAFQLIVNNEGPDPFYQKPLNLITAPIKHMKNAHFLILACFALIGCETTTPSTNEIIRPKIGMTEEAWLKSTHSSILLEMEANRVSYKANEDLYYFEDGKLVKMVAGEKQ
jgi:hypothetical protein